MNTDARISVGLPAHPKTVKLRRRLGDSGPLALIYLFLWAAQNRSDGDLAGMSDEDIEIAAGWLGDSGKLCTELKKVGFIDGEQGTYTIHDWVEHNPWAAGAKSRSDKSRLAGLVRQYGDEKGREMFHAYQARSSATSSNNSSTSSNELSPSTEIAELKHESRSAPSPLPSPLPKQKDSCASADAERADAVASLPKDSQTRFNRFWDAYPKKRSKGDAVRAWKKINPSELLVSRMLSAISSAKTSADWKKNAGQFIPHPATWLNDQAWEDSIGPIAENVGGRVFHDGVPTLRPDEVFS